MSSRLHSWISAVALFAAPVAFATEPQGGDEAVVYEVRRAVVPGEETPRAVWTNPLPAPDFHPLCDDVCEHLRCHCPKLAPLPLVYQAVIADDAEWLSNLLACGLSPDEHTEGGDTPLCAAARLGKLDCVRALLLSGADPDLPGCGGHPPLAIASLRRPVEVIEALLAAGAEPEARFASPVDKAMLEQIPFNDLRAHLASDRGVTALMASSARGDVEAVIALTQHGAKTYTTTQKFRRTSLDFAAVQRFIFLMRVLLGRPPDAEPEILITVDLSDQRAWLTKNGEVVERTTISTGREGHATPAGRYVITDKHPLHKSTLYHVEMPWFMRLNCSAIGLHSGYVTGRPASHGCIRLPASMAKKFFNLAKVGDEVQIVR